LIASIRGPAALPALFFSGTHLMRAVVLGIGNTIHSFDPCIACAIHLTDKDGTAISVKAV
jgi:Ni,Fe-hydrogenase I large subunit